MKVKKETSVCDFCREEDEYMKTCEVCNRDYCSSNECGVDEDWSFPDSRFCNECYTVIEKQFRNNVEELKKKFLRKFPEGLTEEEQEKTLR